MAGKNSCMGLFMIRFLSKARSSLRLRNCSFERLQSVHSGGWGLTPETGLRNRLHEAMMVEEDRV